MLLRAPKLLEIFSGSSTLSKTSEALGFESISVDKNPACEPDICADVLEWTPLEEEIGPVDWLHMSIPCECFSTLQGFNPRHVRQGEEHVVADKVALRARQILDELSQRNPDLIFTIENPASSKLKSHTAVAGLPRFLTDYCAYGYPYKKPTAIWSNLDLGDLKCCAMHCFWKRNHPLSVLKAPRHMRMCMPACLCVHLAFAAARRLVRPAAFRMTPPTLVCSTCSCRQSTHGKPRFYFHQTSRPLCNACYRTPREPRQAEGSPPPAGVEGGREA